MSEEMEIDGKSYISSKRASVISGYAQDYIGQLARKSLIEARRIGGLWYVSMESLEAYKQKAAEFKPEPPARVDMPEPSALVFFDGKEYLSAARAAEETGYTQDYVGQLARSGTIQSRQVGNRWYVERQAIVEHKKEKDSLLAAVQSESVGLVKPVISAPVPFENRSNSSHFGSEPLLNYYKDEGDLLPDTAKDEVTPEPVEDTDNAPETVDPTFIPIKRVQSVPLSVVRSAIRQQSRPQAMSAPKKSLAPLLLGAAATIIIILSAGYASVLKQNSVYAIGGRVNEASIGTLAQNAAGAFTWIGNELEPLLTHELIYQRPSNS